MNVKVGRISFTFHSWFNGFLSVYIYVFIFYIILHIRLLWGKSRYPFSFHVIGWVFYPLTVNIELKFASDETVSQQKRDAIRSIRYPSYSDISLIAPWILAMILIHEEKIGEPTAAMDDPQDSISISIFFDSSTHWKKTWKSRWHQIRQWMIFQKQIHYLNSTFSKGICHTSIL